MERSKRNPVTLRFGEHSCHVFQAVDLLIDSLLFKLNGSQYGHLQITKKGEISVTR